MASARMVVVGGGVLGTMHAYASMRDHTGAWHAGDTVVLATRATLTGIAGAELSAAPIRCCRLQMMQTEPLGEELTTSVADGDSFMTCSAGIAGETFDELELEPAGESS